MFTCELERLAEQYEQSYTINKMLLDKTTPNKLITKWETQNKQEFIIVSSSAKKQNYYQLTFFRNNQPQYDLQRQTNEELAHELTLLDATIHTINYLA
jgi:hypothetical protein